MKLNLGSIQIPINSATKTFAILAKRGAGKTYTAGVMAEEFFKCGIPFVIFDPIDVWWGLRLNKNGKDKGLPVVVFGIKHADILLDREMGRKIAQAIVKENISCVISTFGMPKVGQRHLIAEFAEEILNINNTPRHIFIEEAHEFVPQRVFGGLGKTFNNVSNLVVMGRNRGLGVTLINQRAATINKDVLTQLDTLLAFQNISPQDRKALKEWVEAHAAEGDFEKFFKSLPSLPTGEGWVWSPEFLGIFKKIKIRERETFHPDREKAGEFVIPQLDQIDVQSFISKFSQGQKQEQKKEEPKLEAEKPLKIKEEDLLKEVAKQEAIIEVKNEYESQLVGKDILINKLKSKLHQINVLSGEISESEDLNESPPGGIGIKNETNLMLEKLGGMPKKIYEVLLKHPTGLTRRQIGLMTGYSPTSGSFSNAISKLGTMGLIKKEGEVYKVLLK